MAEKKPIKGFIYVMKSPSIAEVRIGLVKSDKVDALTRRRKQHSAHSPKSYELLRAVLVDDVQKVEGLLHKALAHQRAGKKEFFDIKSVHAMAAMDLVLIGGAKKLPERDRALVNDPPRKSAKPKKERKPSASEKRGVADSDLSRNILKILIDGVAPDVVKPQGLKKKMTTVQLGRQWLRKHYPNEANERFRPSKFYEKRNRWWFTFPCDFFRKRGHLNILLQKRDNPADFYFLRVPFTFFRDHQKDLDIRSDGEKFDLELLGDDNRWLQEKRRGRISFAQFVVRGE